MKTTSTIIRKVSLLMILLMGISFYGQSQVPFKKNVFGVVAGGNLSQMINYKGKSSFGFEGGIYWDWRFTERISLQSYFFYSQQGERERAGVSALKLSYLSMPMMFKYKVTKKLNVMAGFYWNTLLSVRNNTLNRQHFRGSDLGMPLGLSYDLNNFEFGINYNVGLTNITADHAGTNKLKNRWGSVTVAYVFR